MTIRSAQDIFFSLINQQNPGVNRYLTSDNCAASAPVVLSGDASGMNTSVVVTGVVGHGFRDQATFKYNRLGLLDMLAAQGATAIVANTGQSTVADMLASYNAAAKSNLTIGELTNSATDSVLDVGGGYYGVTLTPVAGHLFFNAGVAIKYKGTFSTLKLTGSYTGTATNGTAYSSSLPITGGKTPYTNPRVISGTLPNGFTLTLSGSTLVVAGSPGTVGETRHFVVAVDSDDGQTAQSTAQTILVNGGAQPSLAAWAVTQSTGLTVANLTT